jgi:hypothetical protein
MKRAENYKKVQWETRQDICNAFSDWVSKRGFTNVYAVENSEEKNEGYENNKFTIEIKVGYNDLNEVVK